MAKKTIDRSEPMADKVLEQPGERWQNRIVGLQWEAPDQLLAHPSNFRIHPANQQAAIKRSLDELGWLKPVLVNVRTQHMIDGHERVREAMRQGEPAVPVLYVDVDECEEKQALLLLDRMVGLAIPDVEKVRELMTEAGITAEELRQVIEPMVPGEVEPPEEFPEYGGDIETAYQCPKCGYEWSGKAK